MSGQQATILSYLNEQYHDIRELYNQAKLEENAPQMEKLSKAMAGLAKQIKDQEIHERETLKRDEVRWLATLIGVTVGKSVKKFVDDQDVAVLIIEHILTDIERLVEGKTYGDAN